MKISRLYRRGINTFSKWMATAGVSAALDRRVFARAGAGGPSQGSHHVLVAPPGGGNIGDQAMVESFLEGTTAPVIVVARNADDITIPPEYAPRVRLVVLPALLYSDGKPHFRDIARFRALLSEAASVSVVGADIMDGRYSLRGSVRRANLAEFSASLGIDTRILGFSWHQSPKDGARSALVRASKAGAAPLLRDPVSAERARAQGIEGVREVADLVFATGSSDTSTLDRLGIPEQDRKSLVVVNVSGLIGRTVDQVGEYEAIIGRLRRAGRTIVLLPHVARDLGDDATACAAVCERVGPDGVILVDRLLAPSEIRGLCSVADFVITGRMHLAIMSLWNGKPAITLATQGKVEGMMQMFGIESLCVQSAPGFSDAIGVIVDELTADPGPLTARISERLPGVRSLARQNFAGLS